MKLFIQIPCFNESQTLGKTLSFIPKKISGFKSVEILIIDDGSIDNTSDIAKRAGVKHNTKIAENRIRSLMHDEKFFLDYSSDDTFIFVLK